MALAGRGFVLLPLTTWNITCY